MKRLLIGVAAAASITLIVVAFLVWRLDPEALGARVIDQINRQSGIELETEKVTLHPMRGLEMTNARLSGRLDSGQVHAQVALLRMKHRVLPLLKGELVVDEVLLLQPRIELVVRSTDQMREEKSRRREQKRLARENRQRTQTSDLSSEQDSQEEERKRDLRLSIERLALEDGSFSMRSQDRQRADFSVDDLQLALWRLSFDAAAPSSTQAVSGEGRFSTGRILHGDLEALDSTGSIRLVSGIANLTELNIHSVNTDLMVSALEVFLVQEPPRYTLQAAGGVDLNGVLGVDKADGFGSVAIELGSEGEGPALDAMVGAGTMTLNAGSIPGIPSVMQIEELVGRPLLTGRQYERTEIEYRLIANRLALEPFEIVGQGANIGGAGEIDLGGAVELDIFLRVPRSTLEAGRLDRESLDSLAESDGSVRVPFEIRGTIEDPQVRMTWDGAKALASEAARSWAEQALDEAKKRAAEWLQSQSDNRDDG